MIRSKAVGVSPATSGPNTSAGRLAIALTCSTMLAGMPAVALAQDQVVKLAGTAVELFIQNGYLLGACQAAVTTAILAGAAATGIVTGGFAARLATATRGL